MVRYLSRFAFSSFHLPLLSISMYFQKCVGKTPSLGDKVFSFRKKPLLCTKIKAVIFFFSFFGLVFPQS